MGMAAENILRYIQLESQKEWTIFAKLYYGCFWWKKPITNINKSKKKIYL